MTLKNEYKRMFVQSFKNVKTITNVEFADEERIIKILDQLAETLFDCNFGENKCPGYKIYQNYRIKKELEKEKNNALALKFKVIGTFH